MVLAAVEHPAFRRRAEPRGRSAPGGRGPARTPPTSRSIATPLARASRPASRSSPSDTSSIAVAPAAAAAGPADSGDRGRRYAASELARPRRRRPTRAARAPRPTSPRHPRARRRRRAGRRTGARARGRPGRRARSRRRRPAVRRTGHRRRRRPRAARTPRRGRGPGPPPRTRAGPTGSRGRHDQARGPGPHRGDVGEVLHGGAAADVLARGPRPPEVPVLDQHVGGDHEPPVGCGDDGGVVAGRQERVGARGQEREDAGEQLLLGQLGDERVACVSVGVSPVTRTR